MDNAATGFASTSNNISFKDLLKQKHEDLKKNLVEAKELGEKDQFRLRDLLQKAQKIIEEIPSSDFSSPQKCLNYLSEILKQTGPKGPVTGLALDLISLVTEKANKINNHLTVEKIVGSLLEAVGSENDAKALNNIYQVLEKFSLKKPAVDLTRLVDKRNLNTDKTDKEIIAFLSEM